MKINHYIKILLTLIVLAAMSAAASAQEYIPPVPVNLGSTQGNFFINYTWDAGADNVTDSYNVSVNGVWNNGTTNTFSNDSVLPHGWRNISVFSFNSSGTGTLNETSLSAETQVANNVPVLTSIGDKTVTAGSLLTFTVSATDADTDTLTYGSNATLGTLNTATGVYSWTPTGTDVGTYIWEFNASDGNGGVASETITVTVNPAAPGAPSITGFAPASSVDDIVGNIRTFNITANQTVNVTWYLNGTSLYTNLSVPAGELINYTNTSAAEGFWNVTAVAENTNGTALQIWDWNVSVAPDTTPPEITNFAVSPPTGITISNPATSSADVADANLSGVDFLIIDSNNLVRINQTVLAMLVNRSGLNGTYTSFPWNAFFAFVTNGTEANIVTVMGIDGVPACPFCADNIRVNGLFKKNATEPEIDVDAWFDRSTFNLTNITLPQGPPVEIEDGISTIRFGRLEFANGLENPPSENISPKIYPLYSIGSPANPYLAVGSQPERPRPTGWEFNTVPAGNYTVQVHAFDAAGNHAVLNTNITTADVTPPLITGVVLNPTTPLVGQAVLVTVDATDDTAVTGVKADGIPLAYVSGITWEGTITASAGTHSVNISASDAAVNVAWNNATTYAATTDIDSCGEINAAGTYTLIQNLNSASTCIAITASDVTLDGAGYTITGTGSNYSVYVDGSSGTLTNVTVKNLTVTGWERGIYYYNAANGNIINNTASSNFLAIYLFFSSSNNLTSNTASSNSYGIFLESSSDSNTLTSNTASSNTNNGIYLFSSSNNNLTSNNASSNGIGILLDSSSSNNLTSNTASSNSDAGIVLSSSNSNNLTSNNASSNTFIGIYLDSSSSNNLTSNTASSNTNYGINLFFSSSNNLTSNNASSNSDTGIYLFSSSSNNLTSNNASSNSNYGIYLDSSSNNNLTSNTASSNIVGIYLDSSSNNNNLTSNTASSNTNYGIYLFFSIGNNIYNNYFSNTNNAFDNGPNTWNTTRTLGNNIVGAPYLGGNFWSDYTGTDTDGDGLGDTLLPYNSSDNITGGDYLPLVAGGTSFNISVPVPPIPADTTSSSGTISTPVGDYEWIVMTNNTTIPVTLNVTVTASAPSTATDITSVFAGAIPGIYFEITVNDSAWFNNLSQVQFKAYYDESSIPSNVAENTLRASRYTNGSWVRLDCAELGGCNATLADGTVLYAAGVDTSSNFVYANLSRFSTFAIAGTVSAAGAPSGAPSGGGGGGVPPSGGGPSGGTGGGGVTSSEPLDNIAKAERYDKDLIANTPVTYRFAEPEHSIYEVVVTGKENEGNIALRCEALKGTSKLVTASPPGTVYKNENIWIGTKRIKEALIRFKVENSWLGSNNLAGSDIKMVKWDGSKWVQIETAEKNKDDKYIYYEAKTDTFSHFVITGLKGVEVPRATPAVAVTEPIVGATTPAPAPTEKAPGFELALSAAAFCAVYLFSRKRR